MKLDSILEVRLGQQTDGFEKFPYEEVANQSFSLVYEDFSGMIITIVQYYCGTDPWHLWLKDTFLVPFWYFLCYIVNVHVHLYYIKGTCLLVPMMYVKPLYMPTWSLIMVTCTYLFICTLNSKLCTYMYVHVHTWLHVHIHVMYVVCNVCSMVMYSMYGNVQYVW